MPAPDDLERPSAGRQKPQRRRPKKVILFIDPLPLRCEGIACALEAHARDLRVLPLADPALAAGITRDADPMLVLLNIAGAQVTDAAVTEAVAAIRAHLPTTPIALLAEREIAAEIVTAIETGIRGYIPIRLEPAVMIKALRLVAAGGTFAPAEAFMHAQESEATAVRAGADPAAARADQGEPAVLATLSPRQLAILDLLRTGRSNKAIASELVIPESIVKAEVRRIMQKLNASNRTQVAMLLADKLPNG